MIRDLVAMVMLTGSTGWADAVTVCMEGRNPHLRAIQPSALAYATPHEASQIVIFYDRVLQTVAPFRVPALMAHVIAHEIAHILEGVSRHSGTGIMKAHWSSNDYLEMAWKPLPFTAEDVILIHQGLDARRVQVAKTR